MTRRETDRIFECRGCRCETCRWKGAAGISVGGTRDGAKIPPRLEHPRTDSKLGGDGDVTWKRKSLM